MAALIVHALTTYAQQIDPHAQLSKEAWPRLWQLLEETHPSSEMSLVYRCGPQVKIHLDQLKVALHADSTMPEFDDGSLLGRSWGKLQVQTGPPDVDKIHSQAHYQMAMLGPCSAETCATVSVSH